MLILKVSKLIINRSPLQIYHYIRLKFQRKSLLNYSDTDLLGNFDDKQPCVFVLSTGRTGTQTLSVLLNLAQNVFAYHEPKPELLRIAKLSYEHSDNELAFEVLLEAFFSLRMELLIDALSCDKGYIETTPEASFLAPIILKAVPNVKFIHVVRDPKYVVRSAMRRNWYEGNLDDRNRIVSLPHSKFRKDWEHFCSFKKNVWLWAETNRWILDFTSSLPQNRKLLVHAEDIFSAQEDVICELFSFIGSPVPKKRKIVSVIAKRINVQNSGTFPEINDWPETMLDDLRNLGGEIADVLGYDI